MTEYEIKPQQNNLLLEEKKLVMLDFFIFPKCAWWSIFRYFIKLELDCNRIFCQFFKHILNRLNVSITKFKQIWSCFLLWNKFVYIEEAASEIFIFFFSFFNHLHFLKKLLRCSLMLPELALNSWVQAILPSSWYCRHAPDLILIIV